MRRARVGHGGRPGACVAASAVLGAALGAVLGSPAGLHARPAAAATVQVADTVIPVVAPTVQAAPAARITVPVTLDLSSLDAPLGSYQGQLLFDPAVLTLVSASAGTFQGEVDVNVGGAASGEVTFAGANPNTSLNRGLTTILQLVFDVVNGAGGERSPLDLDVAEVTLAGSLQDLTSKLQVTDGAVLVTPGAIGVSVVPSDLQVEPGSALTVAIEVSLGSSTAVPGAASGTFSWDPLVFQLDSVSAGTLGGELQANTSTPGTVAWAVISTAAPASATFSLAVLHMTAVGASGTSSVLALVLSDLVNEANLASLLPFVAQAAHPVVGVGGAPRLWGDVDFTWRDDPASTAPISATDALICLSAAIGLDTSAHETAACDVVPDAGATYTGEVDAVDALVILTWAVGRPVGSAYRVGEVR